MDTKQEQRISIIERKSMIVTTVKSVLAFDEEYLRIDTERGIIHIEGKGLLIENLSKEKGEIYLTGRIDKLEFHEQKKKK